MKKKGEDGLVEQRSFSGWKYRLCQEKKLKIALLKETVFMVKYRFKGWTIRFTNICGPLTWIKYLQHIRGLNSSPWFLFWFDIVNIMMISLCSLLCDLVLFMGNNEGSFIWILLRYCIRHSASWNLLIIANSMSYVVLRTLCYEDHLRMNNSTGSNNNLRSRDRLRLMII